VDHGRVIAAGTLGDLVRDTVGARRVVTVKLDRAPATPIEGLTGEGDGTIWSGPVRDVDADLATVLQRVAAAGRTVADLEVRQPSLQSVFLHLTGRELRE